MPYIGLIARIIIDLSRLESKNGQIFHTLVIQATYTQRLSDFRETTSNMTEEDAVNISAASWATRPVESSPCSPSNYWLVEYY